MTTVDPPAVTDDWIAWRARVDEQLRHMATKSDLAELSERLTWRIVLVQVGVGGLIVAALKLLP